jgi:hypothetical protein
MAVAQAIRSALKLDACAIVHIGPLPLTVGIDDLTATSYEKAGQSGPIQEAV